MSTVEVRTYYEDGKLVTKVVEPGKAPSGRFTKKEKEKDPESLEAKLALSARQLYSLYALALRLEPTAGVSAVAQSCADAALHVFRSDRAFVYLLPAEELPEHIAVATIDGFDAFPEETGGPQLARTVLERVVRSREAIVSTDAPHDSRFSTSESLVMMNVHSLMAVPLLSGARCFGVLQVDDHRPGLRFGEEDLRLLVAIAAMCARAIEHAELNEQQKRTIDELQHARTRLMRSEELAIVGRTSAALAHEIKNQLGPLMMVDMMRRRFPEDPEMREYADMILEAQHRILRLVEEMRAYAHSDQPALPAALYPTDVGALVHAVVRFLRFDKECRDIPITVTIQSACIVDLDPDRMKQVLMNLLRNAVQAMRGAGTEDPKIQLGVLSDPPDHCRIEVRDNGPGVPNELMDRIFEPFFTTKGNEGTGLGLDICRQIVETHGGALGCRSRPGKGTTMVVRLPERAS